MDSLSKFIDNFPIGLMILTPLVYSVKGILLFLSAILTIKVVGTPKILPYKSLSLVISLNCYPGNVLLFFIPCLALFLLEPSDHTPRGHSDRSEAEFMITRLFDS